jgi:MbtH protein
MSQMGGDARYHVVGNEFGHVSIWPATRDQAPGWRDLGFAGTRQECLDHVAAISGEFESTTARNTR